jgi:hypothetical protein
MFLFAIWLSLTFPLVVRMLASAKREAELWPLLGDMVMTGMFFGD